MYQFHALGNPEIYRNIFGVETPILRLGVLPLLDSPPFLADFPSPGDARDVDTRSH